MMHEISRNIMKYARWNMIMLRDGHDKTTYIITKHMNNSTSMLHLPDTKKTANSTFSSAGVIPCHSGTPALISEQCHITSQKKLLLKLEEYRSLLKLRSFYQKKLHKSQIRVAEKSLPVMEGVPLRVARSSLFHSEDLQAL